MTDKVIKTTEYEDAVNYRNDIESGEINKGGFIPGSKYLKLLDYMEQQLISNSNNAMQLLSDGACKIHSDKIKNMSFPDFVIMSNAVGCKYCLSETKLKDHEIAHFVNELNLIAKTYAGTEQLREHISICVTEMVKP